MLFMLFLLSIFVQLYVFPSLNSEPELNVRTVTQSAFYPVCECKGEVRKLMELLTVEKELTNVFMIDKLRDITFKSSVHGFS
jgi:hypothetical protein